MVSLRPLSQTKKESSSKPFIRWAGSKRQSLTHLRPYWSSAFGRYVEPFAGSACLFFDLNPAEAILADINAELITTYSAIKRNVFRVIEALRRLKKGEKAYYQMRRLSPQMLNEFDLAARFLYLNARCFNGLYRTNLKGEFNVPYRPPGYEAIDEERLVAAAQALIKVSLYQSDFEETLNLVQAGDFVYLDPPYALDGRRVFSQYGPSSFSTSDLRRLGMCLQLISDRGASFVITYGDSPEARRLMRPWKPRRIWTRRNIAGFACNRRGSYELLASNIKLEQLND